MGPLAFIGFGVLLSFGCHKSEAHPPLDSKAILHYKSPIDDKDPGDEIDDLMPGGGADEIPDNEIPDIPKEVKLKMVKRADYGKTLSELMADSSDDTRYAPSDESYEYFAKRSADEFTMEDVKKYEQRNAIGLDKRWPKGIVPYELSQRVSQDPELKAVIYSAMEEWEQKTCVTFEPYSAAVASKVGHDQRVLIQNKYAGCFSAVGKVGALWKKPQDLNLGYGCKYHRTALHELGHALGFHHEQSRMDRDKYVQVNFNNIEPSNAYNYKKAQEEYTTPYDYLSIMHYGPDFFGKEVNGETLIAMTPVDTCYLDVIGKPHHLSYFDHKGMNTRYGCTNGCEATKCGKDCYATKSGENRECHCVCLDNSNNPCKGGSSCFGDEISNCAELFAFAPSLTCKQYADDCCETCKGSNTDPSPSVPSNPDPAPSVPSNPDPSPSVPSNPDPSPSVPSNPDPIGDNESDTLVNCAELLRQNPHFACGIFADQCRKTCKAHNTNQNRCPKGDVSFGCERRIKMFGKSIYCSMLMGRTQCCQSCL